LRFGFTHKKVGRSKCTHGAWRIAYKRKNQRVIGLWSNQVIRRDSRRFGLEVLLSVSRNLLESNETEDNERGVPQNDSHMCLRKEPLHRYLFGLLENFCTSPGGIYYKYGKVAVASTWGKQKRKSNIERIDGIPLFVMPVVSLHTPF